ncbi:MAG: hypothetical protein A3E36_01915 [Candidatus Andersenbacteria bacterium RIFCSPHIGHO2_12_FULL_45_11b]|uniref:ComEC/Rec2-related protein domain-containing protein n=1 Tax=Candidatus Andersenbacteria bacterium RIFCSPHIGHO2_12_FULL_45_11b TaxID=1797282 RepID=A0A1G1X5X2_9BACT|nr:MAG: hypothetical protein A3E36_01915 [Candidatus Andersenbacteria bacterium RIFCSPHIGHO2_12_FULL_45_11b]
MRVRVASLITSWLVGIVAGALSAPHRFTIILIFLGFAFFLYRRIRIQLLIGGCLLVALGYLYGLQSNTKYETSCAPSDTMQATLRKTYALTPTQAQYVFVREDGCTLLVYAPRFPVLVKGTVVSVVGKQETLLRAFASLPEYGEFLRDEGISLVVRNAQVDVLQLGNAPVDMFRIQVVRRIGTLFREPDASLMTAMIAGDQGMIPQSIKDIYRRSGITHILSISGLHVSIIAIVLSFIVGLFHVSSLVRSFIISGLLWTYIVAVGAPASAVRAGVFWTCYVLAYHVRAFVGLLTVILLTLAVLLTISPELVRSIGFELSVVAVCGIGVALFFVRRIRFSSWMQDIATLFAVSLGATIATAPLTLYYFGNVSLAGLVTNIAVVPLLPFVMYLVLVALFFQTFFIPLALVLSFIAHALMTWMLFIATLCASIPYGHFEQISFPIWGIFLYYGLITVLIILLMKHLKIPWRDWWV